MTVSNAIIHVPTDMSLTDSSCVCRPDTVSNVSCRVYAAGPEEDAADSNYHRCSQGDFDPTCVVWHQLIESSDSS